MTVAELRAALNEINDYNDNYEIIVEAGCDCCGDFYINTVIADHRKFLVILR